MNILGLSCYYHDAAAALLQDGNLIAASEEERFSRAKHDSSFPARAIEFCLQRGKLQMEDIDYVVFYEKPFLKFRRIIETALATYPQSPLRFADSTVSWFRERLWIKDRIITELGVEPRQVLFVDHHASHAASAFLCSPFQRAAILTIDGVGERATATMGVGATDPDGSSISITEELHFPHSLGLLYSAFTAFLGFEVNDGEYKVMGMAPYGQPKYLDKIAKVARLNDDGSLWLDLDYFSFAHSTTRAYSSRFLSLFGDPRKSSDEFVTAMTHPGVDATSSKVVENQRHADIAASIQRFTEDAILKMVVHLHRQTGLDSLCFAGGVALNSAANGRILRESPFKNVFIQPSPGDAGGALGAALYAWNVVLKKPRTYRFESPYLGSDATEAEIASAIAERQLPFERINDPAKLVERTVQLILAGKVIGWFQGRFEWGPRALGNRSILADPRKAEMKQVVNSKIKFREPFRPFAPVTPLENAARLFQAPADVLESSPTRYMLAVFPWKPEMGAQVPAVNHEGTGRVQTLLREWNPLYFDLVQTFGAATGIPVLLNTSFNLRGEPIVGSPANACNTFLNSGLDYLVMGDYIVRK